MLSCLSLVLALATLSLAQVPIQTPDGIFVGSFKNYFHDIEGDVYVVDDNTLLIQGFDYDGGGPDAFFWAGKTKRANREGTLIPYELDANGNDLPLGAYSNANITLNLPAGTQASKIKNLSVWCRYIRTNFGDLVFPPGVGDLL